MRHQCEEEAEDQTTMLRPGTAFRSLDGAVNRLSGEPIVNRAVGAVQHREKASNERSRRLQAALRRPNESPSIASRGDHQQAPDEILRVLSQQFKGGRLADNDLCWWMEEPVLIPPPLDR